MKYETFLNDANLKFAKYYLNIYRKVRNKRTALAFADRILVDASSMGGVLETMVREGFNAEELDKFETHLNNMRYVVKVLYRNKYISLRRTRIFLVEARKLEFFVNDPIEVSKIANKRERKRLERILRKKAAEDAYKETYNKYMDDVNKYEAEERTSMSKSAAASVIVASVADSDPDGFNDIYVES
ncbi:MAG: hypothetical protein LUD29_03505 [Clostridia bacterium]|nr:hypothetical protein [Clostridia bacterium]